MTNTRTIYLTKGNPAMAQVLLAFIEAVGGEITSVSFAPVPNGGYVITAEVSALAEQEGK